jgi:nitrite reductase/ring-hydroxylating ferredoxin subunit
MGQFVKVATKAEFEGLETGKLVEAGGQKIAVFNLGGSVYAIGDTCPHRGGPLSEGSIAGDEVTCPWHGANFHVKTGAVTRPPAGTGVRSFVVKVEAGDVLVELE